MPFLSLSSTLNSARVEATSALPNAPVVDDHVRPLLLRRLWDLAARQVRTLRAPADQSTCSSAVKRCPA